MVASLTEPSKKDVPFFIGVQSSTELPQCAGFFLKFTFILLVQPLSLARLGLD